MPAFDIFSLGDPSPKGEVRAYCPFCESQGHKVTHKNLTINIRKGLFFCYRCESRGSNKELGLAFSDESNAVSESLQSLKARLLAPKFPSVKFDLDLISSPVTKAKTPIAYEFMTKTRGFTDEEIEKYGLRTGTTYFEGEKKVSRWSGRILFPFMEDSEVTYVVGRTYVGASIKYLNSVGDKTGVVYGLDSVTDGRFILCEGIISAIAAHRSTGVPAVCLLGKVLTDIQLSKLRNRADEVYVCLDGTEDVTARTRGQMHRRFLQAGFKVWTVPMPPGMDPDDEGPRFKQIFESSRRVRL
jgi:Toprim domain